MFILSGRLGLAWGHCKLISLPSPPPSSPSPPATANPPQKGVGRCTSSIDVRATGRRLAGGAP